MSTRQDQLADAAIEVIGTYGLRKLTHRAVDAWAGVPAGSASNYFRTRDALLNAVVNRLGALDRVDWQRLAETVRPENVEDLAGSLGLFVQIATGPGRSRTLARYALCGEAAVRPGLQEELRRGNAEVMRWAVPWVRQVGSAQPERDCRLILDYLEGVMLHQLAFPDPAFEPLPGIRLLLHSLVAP